VPDPGFDPQEKKKTEQNKTKNKPLETTGL
jgi:hypothetical protein